LEVRVLAYAAVVACHVCGVGGALAHAFRHPHRDGLLKHYQSVHYRRELSTARRPRHPDLRSGRGDAETNRRVFTFALFPAGIFGIGLLAVPVLTASGIRIFLDHDRIRFFEGKAIL
jgi:hypothetical protein